MSAGIDPPVALVTGAARRIGRAIALRLAREGYAVALHCSQSLQEAQSLQKSIEISGGRAVVLQADLADADSCARLISDCFDKFGSLALLVNNASIFEADDAESFTLESLSGHLDINLRAPLLLARDMAKALPAETSASVVNILDQRVAKLTPQFFSYTLSKSALETATHLMAQSLAPRLRVNSVAPGPTFANIRQSPEDFAAQAAATPLGEPIAAEEIADAVIYLANARSVTGQTIFVDAGQRLAWKTIDVAGSE
ncbi:SDR family oxidoreductase [Terrarubrum flagellatum]|uniref:SDR family oxidoreductase n=1 Tax=Terrirubrum flagellatum TaxID=2895980 RepID=UPI0031452F3B